MKTNETGMSYWGFYEKKALKKLSKLDIIYFDEFPSIQIKTIDDLPESIKQHNIF